MIILGIDPGKSGGLALLVDDVVTAIRMPYTDHDLWNVVHRLKNSKPTAFLESVHSFPGEGVKSVFTFGRNYGSLRMALAAAGIPYEEVAPTKWQKSLGLLLTRKKGAPKETKTDKKNRHKAMAQRLFPSVAVTHAIADALLIAEFGRRLKR